MSANGYLQRDELEPIDSGQFLTPAAAPRYMALREAAAAAGHPFSALEGYRSYATQVALWNLYGSPRASYPGTSPHGDGLAVDITNDSDPQGIIRFKDPLYNWLAANAGGYGFNNRVGVSINEPWHWVYDGTGAAGFTAVPFTIEEQEEDEAEMIILYDVTTGLTDEQRRVLYIPGALWKPITAAEAIQYQSLIKARLTALGITRTPKTLNCNAASMAAYKATVPAAG